MNKKNNLRLASLAALSVMSFSAMAQVDGADEVVEKIRSQNSQFAQAEITVHRELSEYGLEGFYEASFAGREMIVSPGGRFVVLGDLFDLRDMRNISEEVRNAKRSEAAKAVVANMKPENLVTFKPNDGVEVIGEIYVFTDPTCPYCQRVHAEIAEYQSAGVTVNYVPYPRSGVSNNGNDYNTLKKIVCADNPQQAMSDFKNSVAGNKYNDVGSAQKCHDIVAAGYAAGQEIGLTGTPFIYLSNGDTIPGYNPAQSVITRFTTGN